MDGMPHGPEGTAISRVVLAATALCPGRSCVRDPARDKNSNPLGTADDAVVNRQMEDAIVAQRSAHASGSGRMSLPPAQDSGSSHWKVFVPTSADGRAVAKAEYRHTTFKEGWSALKKLLEKRIE